MIPSLFVASLMVFAGTDVRLADAAMKRDTATVRSLLLQKVDVNAPGKDGTPALHWVVRVDDLETAQLLIRSGADVKFADRYGVTPLYIACTNGNAAMIKLLLDDSIPAQATLLGQIQNTLASIASNLSPNAFIENIEVRRIA